MPGRRYAPRTWPRRACSSPPAGARVVRRAAGDRGRSGASVADRRACRARPGTGIGSRAPPRRPSGCPGRGPEHLAQLVADQVDDGLEVQASAAMPCWMLLITASSLARCSSCVVRSATCCSSPAAKRRLASAHGGLGGEHREQVALAVAETAERTFDVGVEKAQQLAPRDQRGDEAGALVDRARRPRARGAGALRGSGGPRRARA